MKTCYCCQRELPLERFRRNKRSADGRQGKCVACITHHAGQASSRRRKREIESYEASLLRFPTQLTAAGFILTYLHREIEKLDKAYDETNDDRSRVLLNAMIASHNSLRDVFVELCPETRGLRLVSKGEPDGAA